MNELASGKPVRCTDLLSGISERKLWLMKRVVDYARMHLNVNEARPDHPLAIALRDYDQEP